MTPEQEVAQLREAMREFATHQSWRCEHAPHWHMVDPSRVPEGDCPCGLLGVVKALGLDEA